MVSTPFSSSRLPCPILTCCIRLLFLGQGNGGGGGAAAGKGKGAGGSMKVSAWKGVGGDDHVAGERKKLMLAGRILHGFHPPQKVASAVSDQ